MPALAAGYPEQRRGYLVKKMAFRIDDVCPQMHQERFFLTMDLLGQYGIKPLLGIVPDNQDPYLKHQADADDFWRTMNQLQVEGCVLAMHGYRHVYDIQAKSMVTDGLNSEFAAHPFSVQFDKLKKGMEVLRSKGIQTNVFFAPAHSYNKNTLKALHQLGFKFVSDGRSHYCYERFGLKFIPCRSYRVSVKCKGMTTVALHPCTNWPREYEILKKTLEKNRPYLANYSELLDCQNHRLVWQLADERLYVSYIKYVSPIILLIKGVLRPLWRRIKRFLDGRT
jgi:predicted deacetylase